MQLQRIVIEMKSGELVLHVLYRSKGDSNPRTKARNPRSNPPRPERATGRPGGPGGAGRRGRRVWLPHQRGHYCGHNLTSGTTDSKASEGNMTWKFSRR